MGFAHKRAIQRALVIKGGRSDARHSACAPDDDRRSPAGARTECTNALHQEECVVNRRSRRWPRTRCGAPRAQGREPRSTRGATSLESVRSFLAEPCALGTADGLTCRLVLPAKVRATPLASLCPCWRFGAEHETEPWKREGRLSARRKNGPAPLALRLDEGVTVAVKVDRANRRLHPS